MGRGDLILALVVLAASFGAAAGATAALSWRTAGRGPATGAPLAKPTAYVAASRASASRQLRSSASSGAHDPRVLTVARAGLGRPLPTRGAVTVS